MRFSESSFSAVEGQLPTFHQLLEKLEHARDISSDTRELLWTLVNNARAPVSGRVHVLRLGEKVSEAIVRVVDRQVAGCMAMVQAKVLQVFDADFVYETGAEKESQDILPFIPREAAQPLRIAKLP